MPKVDWSKVEDQGTYAPLPDGTYLCKLTEVKESETVKGDTMWSLVWTVSEGEYERRLIFDRLVFSEKALPRVKLVFKRLGFPVEGEETVTTEMINGMEANITVVEDEFMDMKQEPPAPRKTNRVTFDGYNKDEKPVENKDGLPF